VGESERRTLNRGRVNSNLQAATSSDEEERTLNIERRTSNVEQGREPPRTYNFQLHLTGRSERRTFNVQRPTLNGGDGPTSNLEPPTVYGGGGGGPSTVKVTLEDVLALPFTSVAVTVTVYVPGLDVSENVPSKVEAVPAFNVIGTAEFVPSGLVTVAVTLWMLAEEITVASMVTEPSGWAFVGVGVTLVTDMALPPPAPPPPPHPVKMTARNIERRSV
jgi:hypothetical protein